MRKYQSSYLVLSLLPFDLLLPFEDFFSFVSSNNWKYWSISLLYLFLISVHIPALFHPVKGLIHTLFYSLSPITVYLPNPYFLTVNFDKVELKVISKLNKSFWCVKKHSPKMFN